MSQRPTPPSSRSSTCSRSVQLKAEIRAIAKANTTRTDNLEDVAKELWPKVRELVSLEPPRSPSQTLNLLEGAWKNLWSNLDYGRAPDGSRFVDYDKVFQVVTKRGHYYNLSESVGLPFPAVNALRGAYAPVPGGFAIRFTRNGFFPGTLAGQDLVDLAARIESGAQPLTTFGPQEAPAGPVGQRGKLTTLYVDADFRIAGGEQTPFFDDNGNVLVAGEFDLLFVLDRV